MQNTVCQLTARVCLVAAVVVGAVACGGDDDESSSSGHTTAQSPAGTTAEASTVADAAPTTPAVSADAYPLTIEHKFGATTIGAPPERVVSLGYTEQDAIVAFGVRPVAALRLRSRRRRVLRLGRRGCG